MGRKKNWYLLRKLIYCKTPIRHTLTLAVVLSSLLVLIVFSGCFREEKLYNSWRLQTVLKNNEPLKDSLQFHLIPNYTYYIFYYSNTLEVKTYALGQYVSSPEGHYYFVNHSKLRMRFTIMYNSYDITAKIKKLTNTELVLEYTENGDTYIMKLFGY